ncbi:hypothetical protein NDU88_003887 [Pleurodeles waltl]|uniref:Uncharacterized protein n=1 Tax=Pleurodeles waltl TaxID=8319 RepID=A0AAV7T6J8_PLEWA|nr:hypothetical protein NDU88_003887 [Pleurodeles waltl]
MLNRRRLQGQFVVAGFTTYTRDVRIWASCHPGVDLREVVVDPGGRGRLERELAQLEQEQVLGADDGALGHIRAKLSEFQDTAMAEVQHMGKYAMTRVYGEGERPVSTLAKVIRPNKDNNLTTVIQAEDGSEIRELELIPNRFREYYESLYASRVVQDSEGLLYYLMHNEMPRLADIDRESLGVPLTLEEMNKAIGGMAEGRS